MEGICLSPSSFAITSTFPSPEICAMELFELPQEIPIAYCSGASGVRTPLDSSLILNCDYGKVQHAMILCLSWRGTQVNAKISKESEGD